MLLVSLRYGRSRNGGRCRGAGGFADYGGASEGPVHVVAVNSNRCLDDGVGRVGGVIAAADDDVGQFSVVSLIFGDVPALQGRVQQVGDGRIVRHGDAVQYCGVAQSKPPFSRPAQLADYFAFVVGAYELVKLALHSNLAGFEFGLAGFEVVEALVSSGLAGFEFGLAGFEVVEALVSLGLARFQAAQPLVEPGPGPLPGRPAAR